MENLPSKSQHNDWQTKNSSWLCFCSGGSFSSDILWPVFTFSWINGSNWTHMVHYMLLHLQRMLYCIHSQAFWCSVHRQLGNVDLSISPSNLVVIPATVTTSGTGATQAPPPWNLTGWSDDSLQHRSRAHFSRCLTSSLPLSVGSGDIISG